jgi:hypothetical protein
MLPWNQVAAGPGTAAKPHLNGPVLAVTENSNTAFEGGYTMRKAIALLLGALLPSLD